MISPTRPFKKPVSLRRRVLYWLKLLAFLCITLYIANSIVWEEVYTTISNRALPKATPADYGFSYSEISFPAAEDNLTIRGWLVPAQSERVVLVLHGKGSNRADLLPVVMPLAQNGINLLLIDMRGHGLSDGSNFSYGYFEQRDVLGAVAFLKGRGFKPGHIGIYGYSMGAAPGLLAMSENRDIKALVADSVYANLKEELEYAFPQASLSLLPNFCLPGIMLAARVLHGIDVEAVRLDEAVRKLNGQKLLLIQGDRDMLVPSSNIYRLKAAAGDKAEMWVVPGADHVQAYALHPDEYVNRLITFFKQEL